MLKRCEELLKQKETRDMDKARREFRHIQDSCTKMEALTDPLLNSPSVEIVDEEEEGVASWGGHHINNSN